MSKRETTIRRLIQSAFMLDDDESTSTLKSYLLTRCFRLCEDDYSLPENIFGAEIRCSNCATPWKDGKYTVKVIKLTKSSKRRCKSIIKNKISKRDKQRAKKLLNEDRALIGCSACSKSTEVWFKRSTIKDDGKINSKRAVSDNTSRINPTADDNAKRKKRVKDKFAGLCKTACNAASAQNSNNLMLLLKNSKTSNK